MIEMEVIKNKMNYEENIKKHFEEKLSPFNVAQDIVEWQIAKPVIYPTMDEQELDSYYAWINQEF
jgi:hypothetical protein